MTHKLRVTFDHSLVNGYGLTFPYSEEMVSAIKARVHHALRTWDPENRTWWIHTQADFDELRLATNGWAVFVPRKSES